VTLGEKIRAARLAEGLTQEQLAGDDLSKSYISEVERGRRNPRRVTLKVLAQRLRKPLSYFLDGAAEDREAEVYLGLGLAQLQGGPDDWAVASLNKALDLALQGRSEALPAKVELALAFADQRRGYGQRAQRRLDRCLPIFARTGDADAAASAHYCLGRIRLESGDPASSLWAFQAGLQHSERVAQAPLLRSRLYLGMGTAHHTLGNVPEAREAFGLALDAVQHFLDHHRLASWHLQLAIAAVDEGRLEEASEHTSRAEAIGEAWLLKQTLAEIHERLGRLEGEAGNWEPATVHFRWSVALHGAAADVPAAAQALGGLAEVLLQHAAPEAARAACEGALALLDGETDHRARAHILRVLGAMHRIAGRSDQARAALLESLALSGRLGQKAAVNLARQELAVLALERGDIDEARIHLQTLQKM
jgi:transcriptional regulator with XRE-family HTH domain